MNRIHPEGVASFVMVRNPIKAFLFNIVALDAKDDVYYVHSVDHIYDDAAVLVGVLNAELQPV